MAHEHHTAQGKVRVWSPGNRMTPRQSGRDGQGGRISYLGVKRHSSETIVHGW